MDDRREQYRILAHFTLSGTEFSLEGTEGPSHEESLSLQMTNQRNNCRGVCLRWWRRATVKSVRTARRPPRRGAAHPRYPLCLPSSALLRWRKWPPWKTCTGWWWKTLLWQGSGDPVQLQPFAWNLDVWESSMETWVILSDVTWGIFRKALGWWDFVHHHFYLCDML